MFYDYYPSGMRCDLMRPLGLLPKVHRLYLTVSPFLAW